MDIEKYWAGKRVLITGGSSGLGRALAVELNRLGARVAVVARGQKRLDELRGSHPAIETIQADVASKDATYAISAQAAAKLQGVIDVLVNNASELGPTPLKGLLDTECEDLARVLESNLVGPFRLTKAILPQMLLKKSGTVVSISSDAAVQAYPGWGAYGLSKAAQDHLSRTWGEELKSQGIRFVAVDPGEMDTPMHAAAIPEADPKALKSPDDSARALVRLLASDALPERVTL